MSIMVKWKQMEGGLNNVNNYNWHSPTAQR
jgi:hypothetical protein